MTLADVLEAERVCFGDYGRHMSVRKSPGGEDRLDDLAQAWIDGDHERVLAAARAHEENVRERMKRCTATSRSESGKSPRRRWRKADPEKIRTMRCAGATWKSIALQLGVSWRQVARVLASQRTPSLTLPTTPAAPPSAASVDTASSASTS